MTRAYTRYLIAIFLATEFRLKCKTDAPTQLSSSVADLEAQAAKFKEVYEKLKNENEKLAEVRDGLQEQLNVRLTCPFWSFVKHDQSLTEHIDIDD